MMVEIVVGLLAICAAGYAVHWHRKRVKDKREQAEWDKMREEQLEKLKFLKEKGEK